jgi:V/A-type H+/Na+-transporting ATPase subunit C
MFQVAKYSCTNARVKAMLSYLLAPEIFQQVLQAQGLSSALAILRNTLYKDIIPAAGESAPDLPALERALIRHDIAMHARACSFLPEKEKNFMTLLLQRYEIESLKVILRLWHGKAPVTWKDYISGEKLCFDIDFDKILSASTLEEIIVLLDHTPYRKPLVSAREKFKQKNSLFYLEIALDIDFFTRMMAAADEMSAIDRSMARKLLGVEIDMVNISWLIRMKKYYTFSMGELFDMIIPGGDRITQDTLRSFYVSDGVGKLVDSLALGPYARIRDMSEDSVFLIENFLYEVLMKEVRKALSGFPFTIGVPIAYVVLKMRETKKIISLLYAKHYGWKEEDIALFTGM